jgi:PleD family two-component response regulator
MQLLQTSEDTQTESAVPQDRPPVVLLVDDDPTTLHMLSGMLQQEGIATLTAGTIESARCVASNDAFDLAVLDVHLPDGNGLDLCRWVRQQPPCAGVPVLMLSAEQDVRTKVAGFDIWQLGTGICPQYEARRYLRSVFYQLKGEAERFQHAA